MKKRIKDLIIPKGKIFFIRENISLTKLFVSFLIITAFGILLDNPANSVSFNVFSFSSAFRLNLTLPLIMISGVILGPLWGAIIGSSIDILGFHVYFSEMEYIFPMTLSSGLLGFLSGYIFKIILKKFSLKNIFYSLALPHFLVSVILNPLIINSRFAVPFLENFQIRLATFVTTIPIYSAAAYYIAKYFINSRELKIANDKLREAVKKDDLTGLYNRIEFGNYLEKMISYSKRHNKNLSVLIIDLDHFKDVNDTCGHQTGDEVIVSTADKILNSIRKEDMAARLGGDEFAVLLVDTSQEEAVEFAKRLKNSIADIIIKCIDTKISASFGIASLKNGDKNKSFIRRADQALYKAKECGRNQVRTIK